MSDMQNGGRTLSSIVVSLKFSCEGREKGMCGGRGDIDIDDDNG